MKNLYTIISDEEENISHIVNEGITAAVIIFLYHDERYMNTIGIYRTLYHEMREQLSFDSTLNEI